jgi:folate-binding protein YgfZ
VASDPAIEAALVERVFLRVTGADAAPYLQGQLSQDVDAFDRVGKASFLLDPGGKVVALLRVARDGEGFVLDTDAAAGDAVEARLRRFVLRVDVAIERVDGWACVRLWGAPPLPQAGSPGAWPAPPYPQDLVGPDAEAAAAELAVRWLDALDAERRRIAAGMPVSGVDIGPETIPAEVGRWAIEQAVSFTKGCYTGQELVARIDSRGGNVPRPLRVVRAVGGADLHAPAPVYAGGREVGHLTSAACDVGLGPIGRAVEPGTTVEVRHGGQHIEARIDAAA